MKKEKIKKERKKLGQKAKSILCVVLAIAVALSGFGIYKWIKNKKTANVMDSGTSIVRAGNLTNSISGSGSVEPIDQRDIVPEVNGKIIEAPFEEGDEVKEGDILYRFEMTAATNAIESAENSVSKSQTNLSNKQSNLTKVQEKIDNLTIKASASGRIDKLSLLVGEDASGMICTITNYKEQTVTLPFNSAKINEIQVGDSANVAVEKYMMNTTGTVTRKYGTPSTLSNGAVVYNVEILLDDDYILEENVNVTATVNGITSASYGSVKYAYPVTINAGQKGEVKTINYKNGDWVEKGAVIAVLENKDLDDELRNAQQSLSEARMNLTEAENNLEDKQEEANEYIVVSPINGVVLTKDYEVGDTISGQNSTVLMVVADMSKMKFTISADELDISKIAVGQSVSVTADALTGQRLMGRITAISKLGTSSNGVTNYPIEVTIDEPGDLLPGMNVNANIIIEQAFNTLYLPAEAVEYFGGKYYVTIVGEVTNMPERVEMPAGGFGGFGGGQRPSENADGDNKTEDGNSSTEQESQMPQGGQRPEGGNGGGPGGYGGQGFGRGEGGQGFGGGQRPGGNTEEKSTEESGNNENKSENKSGNEGDKQSQRGPGGNNQGGQKQEELKIKKYKEEKRVEVEVGIITDTAYEIKSGVEYGQVVKNTTQTSSSLRGGFGMMGGGMGGNRSGMPGGGMMGGGMPSGMSGNRSSGMSGNRSSSMGGNRSAGGR